MGFLGVFTRFVGQRGTGIIQRKGVVTVVDIGVQVGQADIGLCIGLPGQFGAQQLFVDVLGVVTIQKGVFHIAVGLKTLHGNTALQVIAEAARQCTTQTEA